MVGQMEQRKRSESSLLQSRRDDFEVPNDSERYQKEKQIRPKDLESCKRSVLLETVARKRFIPLMRELFRVLQKEKLLEILKECEWNISKAARIMSFNRANLHRLMRRHQITNWKSEQRRFF